MTLSSIVDQRETSGLENSPRASAMSSFVCNLTCAMIVMYLMVTHYCNIVIVIFPPCFYADCSCKHFRLCSCLYRSFQVFLLVVIIGRTKWRVFLLVKLSDVVGLCMGMKKLEECFTKLWRTHRRYMIL